MGDIYLSSVNAVIEVQTNGTGRGAREIVDLSAEVKPTLGGFDKDYGAITRGYVLSPRNNQPVPLPVRREAPEPITPEFTSKMVVFNYMEQFGPEARLGLYVRHVAEGDPSDPMNYARVDVLNDVALASLNYGDMVADEQNTDMMTLTVPLNAAAHVLVLPVSGKKLSTAWTSANDCNVTAADVDTDGTIYAVTAADPVGGKPFLLKSSDGGATWSETELAALSVDCTAVVVVGDKLLIAAGTTIALYDKNGTQLNAYTASGNVAALAAPDAANLVAAGADGLVLVSDDGGYTWTALTSGTSNDLGALAVRGLTRWYVGGANGTLLEYDRGTLSALTLPSGLSAVTVNAIALPYAPSGFSRRDDIYIGMGNGTLYRSTDGGANWDEVSLPGSGSGTVADVRLVELLGQVLYVVHTDASGNSVVLRDWSGGAGGINVETLDTPSNSGLTVLVPVTANDAYVFGNVHGGAELVVKVEK